MRNTSSKVHSRRCPASATHPTRSYVTSHQASWIKRAAAAWEIGGWMRALAEGGYGINVARNVSMMQELQAR
jgi:hypothetical protein